LSDRSYEERIADYLHSPVNRANAVAIFSLITSQYKKNTDVGRLRQEALKDNSKLMSAIERLQEKILQDEEYSASIIPTVISSDEARNLLFCNEIRPTTEGIYFWLFYILTGFASGFSIVSLINLDEKAVEDFRNDLIQHEGILRGRVNRSVFQEITGRLPFSEYAFGFELLNYFVFWFRNKQLMEKAQFEEDLKKMGVTDEEIPKLVGVKDDAALVVYSIPRGKKRRVEFIPKTKNFIARWYSSFLTNPNIAQPQLGRFLSSLYVSSSKESRSVMDKFLLYLLRDEVDGTLIEEMLGIRVDEMTKSVRPLPHARFFFSKLQ